MEPDARELLTYHQALLVVDGIVPRQAAEDEPGTDILTTLREVRSTLTVVQAIGVCRLTLQEILDRLDAIIEEVRDAWSVDRPLARCRSLRPATPAEEGEVAALLRAGAGAGICWASDDDDGEDA